MQAMVEMYQSGKSVAEVAKAFGFAISTARARLLSAGVQFRTPAEGIKLAGPRLSAMRRGRSRGPMSDQQRRKISEGRQAWAEANAKGTRITKSGYVEYTRGPHKGRLVHDVMVEERIGRRLLPGEHVHHVDEDKQNNTPENLALLTIAGHMRLHRILDSLQGKQRKRDNGRFA